ncbi:alpha/beta fold hydrolase [Chloroflexota bacterium]
MTTDRTNQQIKLKDGRSLGYAEYGSPDGKTILCFHGFPGSRLDWMYFDDACKPETLNARIIVADRPGMGLSDFKSGRRLLDWADDVVELAEALQLDRFAVLGISGGGPYTAACAYKIPERLTVAAIISGMGPSEAPGSKEGAAWIFPGKPSIIRRLILMLTSMGMQKKPERIESQMVDGLKGSDKALFLEKPKIAKRIIESWQEAFRSGIAGVNHEAALYTRPWQFNLEDINIETYLWHGDQDENVPISVGRYVANAIPKCQAAFIENEGHFSLAYKYLRECLSVLVA